MESIALFWIRRDLRWHDNTALFHALNSGLKVLPIFIYDTEILNKLPDKKDARITFIHQQIERMREEFQKADSDILLLHHTPIEAFKRLLKQYRVKQVYYNHDYEPYATKRDKEVQEFLQERKIEVHSYKDQVIFEKGDVLKKDGKPYTVFTPYSKKWKEKWYQSKVKINTIKLTSGQLVKIDQPSAFNLKSIGFEENKTIPIPSSKIAKNTLQNYKELRDYPAEDGTSRLGVHLRFGTISIRELVKTAEKESETFLNELIWREFYMMILWHFPHVVEKSFKPAYDKLHWENNMDYFEKWSNGMTGFPIVDAGMRQLNQTGYMHNRLRMITASFLTKHLLTDWRLGEAYFAEKLLDYELASNNGGWQWAAGTGCDAAPYFRIFNPYTQAEKFDSQKKFIKKWIPELESKQYPPPVVNHSEARQRALNFYKNALK